jgi:large subunit ribosomal protein L13
MLPISKSVVTKKTKKTGSVYYKHTGFPGGLKKTTLGTILEGRFPERAIELSVRRMMPTNKMRKHLMRHLYIYKGDTHPHIAQCPKPLSF